MTGTFDLQYIKCKEGPCGNVTLINDWRVFISTAFQL